MSKQRFNSLKYTAGIAVIALAVLWSVSLSSCRKCSTFDDEQAIREMIDSAAKHAEEHDIAGIMSFTNEEFVLQPGQRGPKKVKQGLFLAFRYYGKFSIKYPRPTVNVDKTNAYAEAIIPFVIVPKNKTLPDLSNVIDDPEAFLKKVDTLADLYHLELWLKKEGDTWKARRARIQGGSPQVPRI